MGLITLTNIEDGQDAVANALNERFGKVVDEINGNIDSQNLKNNAVTREKIAPQSITSDKLFVDRYVDENGWTVSDYGGYKRYSRHGVYTGTLPAHGWGIQRTDISFPAGCDYQDIVGSFISSNDQAIQATFSHFGSDKKIAFAVLNSYGQALTINFKWSLTFEK